MKKLVFFLPFVSTFLFLLTDIFGGIWTSNYNWLSDTISVLTETNATRQFPLSLLFIISGLILLFYSYLIVKTHWNINKIENFFLTIICLTGILMMIFPWDSQNGIIGLSSIVHTILSILSFISSVICIFFFKKNYSDKIINVLLAIILVSGILTPFLIVLHSPITGLSERLVIYCFFSFIVYFTNLYRTGSFFIHDP